MSQMIASTTPESEHPAVLTIGDTASATTRVTDADTAEVLSQNADDAFPAVYATSRMIGLMELAAARVMRPALCRGELSVGVVIDITHLAATPVGMEVSAEARYVGRDGKLFVFEVSARERWRNRQRHTPARSRESVDDRRLG